jgi:predicted MFS family arabinose efflux permease
VDCDRFAPAHNLANEELVAYPVAFVGFYYHQRWKSRRGLSPLLETDLFGDRAFNVGALLILIFWGSTTPCSFSYVLLMQTGYGHSPLVTAASLAILGGAFGIVSLIAGRLASFGLHRIMMAGVLVDLIGMLLALVLIAQISSVAPQRAKRPMVASRRSR